MGPVDWLEDEMFTVRWTGWRIRCFSLAVNHINLGQIEI